MVSEPAGVPVGDSQEDFEKSEICIPERNPREWGIAAGLFLLSVLYLWPFRVVSTLNPDEGIALQGAQRILGGQVLYRDFFSFLTPGSYYWLALRFRILGDSFLVARAALLIYGGVFSAVTYLLARRVCSRWIAALTAGLLLVVCLPLRFIVLHNWDSTLLAFLALYCAVRLLESPGWGWGFGVGTLTSLTFLFEQSKGAGLLLGLILGFFLIMPRQARRKFLSRRWIGVTLAGLTWPVAGVVFYFAVKGCLALMLADWFWPLQHYSEANRLPYGFINIPFQAWEELYGGGGMRRLLNIFFTSPLFILPLLPFLALGVGGFHAYRLRRNPLGEEVSSYYVLVCAVSLGLVFSTVATGRPDSNHFFFLGPPLGVVLAWMIGGWPVPAKRLRKIQPLCVTYVLISFTAFGLILFVGGPLGAKSRLETRRGTVVLNGPDGVVPYVQQHVAAGDKILVYPYQPMYYFLTATFGPTRYEYLQLGLHTPGQIRQVVDELALDRTQVVLYAPTFNTETLTEVWPSTPQAALRADPVRDFLFAHYRPCATLKSVHWPFVFMVRLETPCPGEIPSQ